MNLRRTVGLSIIAVLVGIPAAAQTVRRVAADGSGAHTTIQACVAAAQPGDTCLVAAGTYNERVVSARSGTADARIRLMAEPGRVTVKAFLIRHAFLTVQGFDVYGATASYTGMIQIEPGGDDCEVIDNTMRGSTGSIYGLRFASSGGVSANRCVVRGNTIKNLVYVFLNVNGDGHLFESNTFTQQNSADMIRLFGTNHIFRRNVFTLGTSTSGHRDFVQTFGSSSGTGTSNILFEENWIVDLSTQLTQINAGSGVVFSGILYDNVKDITFRRNIIAHVSSNANIAMPGVVWDHNTFYRLAYNQAGIGYGGTLTRGMAQRGQVTNNVLLANGSAPQVTNGTTGWYSVSGQALTPEALAVYVTREEPFSGGGPITKALFADLRVQGYLTSNGYPTTKAIALDSIDTFTLNSAHAVYHAATYARLREAAALHVQTRTTFVGDYNYVAGSPAAGYPKKRTADCVPGVTLTSQNFCEAHGINGGDPMLRNVADLLGPDGLPFTLDDGLKPLPGSPLCKAGKDGSDIGAYSCDPMKVFVTDPVCFCPCPCTVPGAIKVGMAIAVGPVVARH